MRIFIDREEKVFDFSEDESKNVETILKKIEEFVSKEGKVFTRISVNGEVIDDENKDRILSLSPEKVEQILLDTANPRELSIEALEELIEYLPKLKEGTETVAKLLSVGEYEKGYALFAKVIDGINWFVKLLKTLPPVTGMNYSEINYKDSNVSSAFSYFERVMNSLLVAFEKKDDAKIATLLKDELSPVLDEWIEIAKILKDYVEGPIN